MSGGIVATEYVGIKRMKLKKSPRTRTEAALKMVGRHTLHPRITSTTSTTDDSFPSIEVYHLDLNVDLVAALGHSFMLCMSSEVWIPPTIVGKESSTGRCGGLEETASFDEEI